MGSRIVGTKFDRAFEFSFGTFPIPQPEHVHEADCGMRFAEILVDLQGLCSCAFRLPPVFNVKRISLRETCVCERIVRVFSNRSLEITNTQVNAFAGSLAQEEPAFPAGLIRIKVQRAWRRG